MQRQETEDPPVPFTVQLRRSWRRCVRLCKILRSPQKLWTLATEFLDAWVTRRVLVVFLSIEVLSSGVAGFFFLKFRDVAKLGFLINGSVFYSLFMILRAACSVLGLAATIRRKVTLTKVYWYMLGCNIPVTLLCCVPLWNCDCVCEQSWDTHSVLQCKVLANFKTVFPSADAPDSVPIAAANVPVLQSHAAAAALAVSNSVGRFATTSARRLRRCTAIGRRLDDANDRIAGRVLRRLKAHPLMVLEHFNATRKGIGWISKSAPICAKQNVLIDNDDMLHARNVLRRLNNGKIEPIEFMAIHWAKALAQRLKGCMKEELCGVVEAGIEERDAAVRQSAGSAKFALRICTLQQPIMPVLQLATKSAPVLLQKNVVLSAGEGERIQFEEDETSDKCYACVTLVMLALIFLDIVSLPMFIIVLKFLKRRCGDYLRRERQFSVDFDSSDEEGDDFTVSDGSSWIAGGAMRIPSSVMVPARSSASVAPDSQFTGEGQSSRGLSWGRPVHKQQGIGTSSIELGGAPPHWGAQSRITGTIAPPPTPQGLPGMDRQGSESMEGIRQTDTDASDSSMFERATSPTTPWNAGGAAATPPASSRTGYFNWG